MTPQGPISRLQVFQNKLDTDPTWETYLGMRRLFFKCLINVIK